MSSNLPPGVSESMIPGNRPMDQETEITLIFTTGEIDELKQYVDYQRKLPKSERHELWEIIENMLDQVKEG